MIFHTASIRCEGRTGGNADSFAERFAVERPCINLLWKLEPEEKSSLSVDVAVR